MSRHWRKPRAVPDDDDQKYREFAGLINVLSPKDIGFTALTIADNVLCTDSKKFITRPGFTLFRAGAAVSAYVVGDFLYLAEGGQLLRVVSASEARVLASGLTGTNYCWDSINGVGYFVNGVEAGAVLGDQMLPMRIAPPAAFSVIVADPGTLPATPFNVGQRYVSALWRLCATYETFDGRESAPSDIIEISAPTTTRRFSVSIPHQYARTNVYVTEPDGTVFRLAGVSTAENFSVVPAQAGRELTSLGTFPMPDGVDQIVYWQGRIFVSSYDPAQNISYLWPSKPYAFHLFPLGEEYYPLPGRVAVLLSCNEGLLVGTTERVYLYDGNKLDEIADYGCVPGCSGTTTPDGTAFFWTTRGICQAMPFKNLTEETVGMPPGLWANTSLVYLNGMQQVVVTTQGGGPPFNVRS